MTIPKFKSMDTDLLTQVSKNCHNNRYICEARSALKERKLLLLKQLEAIEHAEKAIEKNIIFSMKLRIARIRTKL